MDMDGQLRPAPVEPPRVDREALAADLLRNITADVGEKIVDWPAKMVAGHIHALIEATLGPAFPTLATPAPVAPTAGKYEPKTLDYVTWGSCVSVWQVLSADQRGIYVARVQIPSVESCYLLPYEIETLRLATAHEVERAGLAVPPPAPTPAPEAGANLSESAHEQIRRLAQVIMTEIPGEPSTSESAVECAIRLLRKAHAPAPELSPPAPEAKRPTHVRVTRLGRVDAGVTVGKVYRVESWWKEDGSPFVLNDDGVEVSLSTPDGYDAQDFPSWEPAPCPPPVAGSAEDVAVRDAEARVIAAAIAWNAKYNSDEVKYPEGAHSARLDLNDAVAALAEARAALSSPVRP